MSKKENNLQASTFYSKTFLVRLPSDCLIPHIIQTSCLVLSSDNIYKLNKPENHPSSGSDSKFHVA